MPLTYQHIQPSELKEIWGIVHHNGGHLVPPIDDDGVESFMGYPSEQDALDAMNSQLDKGYIDEECEVVCLYRRE